jgi:hypothetical protein
MSTTIFEVAKALLSLGVDDKTMRLLTEDPNQWNMFGKKDSHLLRAKLFKLFTEAKLGKEAIFMIFFFFSVIKNRNRVINSFDELSDEIKAIPSVTDAKKFIQEYLVQYTSQESSKKFAVVHLPTTMPGLDIMMSALILSDTDHDMESYIFSRQTFAQLNISPELQSINMTAQQVFWNNIVKSSKNEARANKTVTEDLKFNEDYYKTSAADKYLLVDINFKEVIPKNASLGYTKEELKTWFHKLKEDQEKKIKTKATPEKK